MTDNKQDTTQDNKNQTNQTKQPNPKKSKFLGSSFSSFEKEMEEKDSVETVEEKTKTNQTTQPKTKKYKVILVAPSYLVYDDGNKNGIFISGDFSNKYKIGDFIEI